MSTPGGDKIYGGEKAEELLKKYKLLVDINFSKLFRDAGDFYVVDERASFLILSLVGVELKFL